MAIRLGSAYGQVILDATGVLKGTQQAEGALLGLEKRGAAAMAALGLSIGGLALGAVKLGKATTSMAGAFQSNVTELDLATDDLTMSYSRLHDVSLQVGGDQRLLGVSATGAADALTGLYKSGMSTTVIFGDLNGYMAGTAKLGGALRASIDLAAASELDMVQSSELAAVTLSTFGGELETDAEKAEFVNKAMDNFVRAADASVANVSDLSAALVNVAPNAARLGFSLEDTNNALAILSTRGIKGAEAGTALKSMLLNLNRPVPKVTEALQELNVSLYDTDGHMRSLPDIIGQLEDAFEGLTDQQRDQYMQTLAGNYGITAMSTLLAEGTEGWYAMADATAHATGIQEKAAAMAATYEGRSEALRSNLEALGIAIGEKLLPVAGDWVEFLIELIDEKGPAVIETVGQIAEVFQWFSDGLQGQGTVLQNTVVQLGGVSLAALGIGKAYQGLAPIMRPAVTEIGTLVGDLVTKFQLLKEGAKVGEVAALGWSSSLLPVVAALAAVAAWLAVINKHRQIEQGVEEKTAETADQWTGFLNAQAEAYGNATGVATAYVRKQEEINQVVFDGGIAAKLFIDRQRVANAGTETLGKTLLTAATDYEDYEIAVKKVNAGMLAQAESTEDVLWVVDNAIKPVSQLTFELLRGNTTMESGFVAAQMMTGAVETLTVAEAEVEAESRRVALANQTLGGSLLGTITSMQALGVITRQEAQGMRATLVDEFGQITTETEALKAVQEGLAEASATAWETFAQNVYTGVQNALTAYREGNKELYAEQQAALGQMLLGQAEIALANKEITETQMKALRVAVHEEYGIAVDEAKVGSDRLLALFADWVNEGGTRIDELIGFIQNVGPETEQMADDQEAALLRADERWINYRDNVMDQGMQAALAAEAMTTDIGGDLDTMGGHLDTAVTKIGLVAGALWGLPSEHTFTLRLKTEGTLPSLPGGPDSSHPGSSQAFAGGTDYAPGGWSLVGELGPELTYLERGTQVLNARETAMMLSSAAELASHLQARGLAGGAAVEADAAIRHAMQRVTVQMTNYVRDEIDIELLARRVAEYVQRRA